MRNVLHNEMKMFKVPHYNKVIVPSTSPSKVIKFGDLPNYDNMPKDMW